MRALMLLPLLALAACKTSYVTDVQLKNELTVMGYKGVILQNGRVQCLHGGNGRTFIGTTDNGAKVIGKICGKFTGQSARPVDWDISTIKVLSGHVGYGWKNPSLNHW